MVDAMFKTATISEAVQVDKKFTNKLVFEWYRRRVVQISNR